MSAPRPSDIHAMTHRYLEPPVHDTSEGSPRRVGVEVELAGLPLPQVVELVARQVGDGERHSVAPTHAELSSRWGTFRVELDAPKLQDQAYLKPLESLGLDPASETSKAIDEAVLSVAQQVVPLEVVTPPMPWSALAELDPLWEALRAAGAKGTLDSVVNAFGLHLNPEVPDTSVATTLAVLQGYLLLEDWLAEQLEVDLSRQVVPFIRGFPEPYRRLVLSPSYRPGSWETFVDDYLRHNPTRNRRLDLLPLVRHVTELDLAERVREWHLVQPRPTWHYRLPNCDIDRAGWTPAEAWNGWVLVERLARDESLRAELARAYLDTTDWPLRMQKHGWIEQVRLQLPRLLEGGPPS